MAPGVSALELPSESLDGVFDVARTEISARGGFVSRKIAPGPDAHGGVGLFATADISAGELVGDLPPGSLLVSDYDQSLAESLLNLQTNSTQRRDAGDADTAEAGFQRFQQLYLGTVFAHRVGEARSLRLALAKEACVYPSRSAMLARRYVAHYLSQHHRDRESNLLEADLRWIFEARAFPRAAFLREEEMRASFSSSSSGHSAAQAADVAQKKMILAPFFDFLNHQALPNIVVRRSAEHDEEVGIQFVSLAAIAKGEELYLRYSREIEAARFGFVGDVATEGLAVNYTSPDPMGFGESSTSRGDVGVGNAAEMVGNLEVGLLATPCSNWPFCPQKIGGKTREDKDFDSDDKGAFSDGDTTIFAHTLTCPMPDAPSLRQFFDFAEAVGNETNRTLAEVLEPSVKKYLDVRGLAGGKGAHFLSDYNGSNSSNPCLDFAVSEATPVLALSRYLASAGQAKSRTPSTLPKKNAKTLQHRLSELVDECATNMGRVLRLAEDEPSSPTADKIRRGEALMQSASPLPLSPQQVLLFWCSVGYLILFAVALFILRRRRTKGKPLRRTNKGKDPAAKQKQN